MASSISPDISMSSNNHQNINSNTLDLDLYSGWINMPPAPFNANTASARHACQQPEMHRALASCRILWQFRGACNGDLPDLRMHVVWILSSFLVSLCLYYSTGSLCLVNQAGDWPGEGLGHGSRVDDRAVLLHHQFRSHPLSMKADSIPYSGVVTIECRV